MQELREGDMVRLKAPIDAINEWSLFSPAAHGPGVPVSYLEALCEWASLPYLEVAWLQKHDGNNPWPILINPPKFLLDIGAISLEGFNSGNGIYVPESMLIKVTEEELRHEIQEA